QIGSSDHRFLAGGESQQADLLKLEAGVQPGPVGAEQQLAGAGLGDRLHKVVEAPYARGVGEDVRVKAQLADQLDVRFPIVHEGAEMRDYEAHVTVLGRHHVDQFSAPD